MNHDIPQIDDSQMLNKDRLSEILITLYEWGIDDVLLQDGEVIGVQRYGNLISVGKRPLVLDEIEAVLNEMHMTSSAGMLRKGSDHDFAFAVKKDRNTSYRFRVNATASLGLHGSPVGVDITMRQIPSVPPDMEALGFDERLAEALFPRTGIVIMGGATGSGKTTSIAAIMKKILTSSDPKRVLSYESPVEYDLRNIANRTGRISQVEVYQNLPDYAKATSNALRRHPDVIYLGEARDAETIKGAIDNAETGHAAYTTVHVNSASETFSRMIGVFSPQDRSRALSGLIGSTRVLIYQTLVQTVDGRRAAAREYLIMTDALREELYATPEDQVTRVMKRMVQDHGCPLIESVRRLYEAGKVSRETFGRYQMEVS